MIHEWRLCLIKSPFDQQITISLRETRPNSTVQYGHLTPLQNVVLIPAEYRDPGIGVAQYRNTVLEKHSGIAIPTWLVLGWVTVRED